jgi:hypothetical protein
MFVRTRRSNGKKKQFMTIYDNTGCVSRRVEIKTKTDDSVWSLMKKYINSFPNGSIITRQELINAIYTEDISKTYTTVDSYKGNLMNLGYFGKAGRGKYEKMCNIPERLTTSAVAKALQDDSWKQWFIPLHERLGVDEHEVPKQQSDCI